MATLSKAGRTIAAGSAKAQGYKAKPASRVRAAQSNQNEEKSDTTGGQLLAYPGPHQGGPDILKLRI
jgi:hypothetical protein